MARTNTKVTNCFSVATGMPTSLFSKVETRADQYNSGDITADYVSAVQDQIAAEQKLVDDIRAQLVPAVEVEAEQDTALSKKESDGVSRRNFLLATAAAATSTGSNAGVTLGKAAPVPAGIFSQSVAPDIAKLLIGNGATNMNGAKVLAQVMQQIAQSGPPQLRQLAATIARMLPKDNLLLTVDQTGLWNAHGAVSWKMGMPHLMLYTAEGRTGLTYGTLLHEALHVVVLAKYKTLSTALIRGNDGKLGVAEPKAAAQMEQFKKVWQEFGTLYAQDSRKHDKDLKLSLEEAAGNPDEFFVRALTDSRLQQYLSENKYMGKTLFERFKDWVKGIFFKDGIEASWLDAALAATADLTDAMNNDSSDYARLRASSTLASKRAELSKVALDDASPDVVFSKVAPANLQTRPAAQVTSTIDKLPAALRPLARDITKALSAFGSRSLNATMFTEDLLNRAAAIGIKAAKTYKDLANERANYTGAHERVVLDVVSQYNDLPDHLKGKGPGTANQFLYDSTMQRKWGYQPAWMNWKVEVDPATETAYKALGAEGQAFVDNVFKLGSETLAEKKKAVIEGATTEYNILIAKAKSDGNTAEVAELEAEKIKTLKNFGSLMKQSDKTPYAPIKRFGDIVVQAMSKEYIAAKEADDRTKMRELEKDEKHYYVNFTETRADAERELDKLRATGFYVDPGYRERELAREDLYGGSKTLQAISGLRARVTAMADSAAGPEAEVSKKMTKLLTDLYLMQLGEDSARASEMNRRNIAGDVDMIRSVEAQGLADARLLGSIVYGQPMMESINDMRKAVKQGPAATHDEKSQVFNELMARHLQALEYKPTPWANKMVKATSIWFLATSPSYYIQNATQPWMMSLPMMAAKHGYAASGSALTKAYSDIAGTLGNNKVWNQMDFETMLSPANKTLTAGEKDAIRKLLNSGRIDIGMLSELGEARVDPDNKASRAWNRVDQGLRGMQLKLESINRVTTALASYRLNEKEGAQAAYEYADDILQQTHGDYSAWNAPRAFNGGFGKVALQFRKYQLIQLTLMAKLLKNSFGNAPVQEKAIARKALAYTLGQAFLVGGGKALPVPFVLSWLFAAAFGDDAGEPPEYLVRQWIGDKFIADVLLDGAISATTGTNMTSIGGFGNALALAPFADFDLTNRKAATEYAFTLMSGPFGGLGLRAADGVGKISNGDLYGGLSNFAPKGVTNLMKAGDMAANGVTKSNGDLAMSPDEITAWDTAQQAIGFTPSRQVRRMYENDANFKIERAVDTDSGRIKADYKKAVRAGDSTATAEARKDWEALQSVKVRFNMKRSELTIDDAKPSKTNDGLKDRVKQY